MVLVDFSGMSPIMKESTALWKMGRKAGLMWFAEAMRSPSME